MKFEDTHFEYSLYSTYSQKKPSIEDSAVENWCKPMEWASPCTQKDSVESFRACARFRIRRVRAWNKCPCMCQSEIWANKCWKLSAAWKLFQADSGFVVRKRIEKEHPIKMIKMWISYFPSFLGFYNHGWPLNPPLLRSMQPLSQQQQQLLQQINQKTNQQHLQSLGPSQDLTPKRFRAPYICRSSSKGYSGDQSLSSDHQFMGFLSWGYWLGQSE